MPEVLQIKDPRKTKMDIDGSAAVFVEDFGRIEVARIPENFFPKNVNYESLLTYM